ncbi:NAD(P)/FAD-dependent oxidoreductase [Nocardia anaemiae]|uniref:NAD(P)/FAD-dependent oxidoreductase n=1 Tax=Nocardia anaemiae TaxID=263910 RepID=UPI0007A551EB|nr:NAD(P)/FAD-dependent oxidoreductase [Nocardia anaemiae]
MASTGEEPLVIDEYDVVVVGGSLAGCAAAINFGRRGFRVAVLEAHRDPAFYKRLCTHLIQPTSLPAVQRLGLDGPIEAAGGVRMHTSFWTPVGWAHEHSVADLDRHGYILRRSVLDPLIREMAAAAPGVDLVLGAKVRELHRTGGRIDGVVAHIDGAERTVRGRLVIGADGVNSRIAEAGALPARLSPNRRASYFAYFRNVPIPEGNFRVWLMPPDALGLINSDDGLTLVSMLVDKQRVPDLLEGREDYFRRRFAELPDPPDLSRAERVSDIIGTKDRPNVTRLRIVRPGLALVGDAALAADPLRGVGCGWAIESAEWLADATADALATGDPDLLDAALRRYQRRHRRQLWPQQLVFNRNSRQAAPPPPVRKLLATAAADPYVAERFWPVIQRTASAKTLLSRRVLAAVRRTGGGRLDGWRIPEPTASSRPELFIDQVE